MKDQTDPAGGPAAAARRDILLVDDSGVERHLLRARLERQGYTVIEASNGEEAADLLAERHIPLVLTDWMMPGLSGPELCRRLRAGHGGPDRPYTYIVLLTARDGPEAIAEGLDAGADDFLSKPVTAGELAARLAAGLRVLDMQARARAQAAALARAYDALSKVHRRMERDLEAAAEMQRGALPEQDMRVAGFRVASLYLPAGHVGGDHLGHVTAGSGRLAAFSVDVSGHGVASALETVRLAELLRPGADAKGGRIRLRGPHGFDPPHEIVARLNALSLERERSDLYFTTAMVTLDAARETGLLCRAGHPEPLILRASGAVEVLRTGGGPPVGLLPVEDYRSEAFRFGRADRLLLYTDGLSEVARRDGSLLDTQGLAGHLAACADLPAPALLAALAERVRAEQGGRALEDDASALLIEAPD